MAIELVTAYKGKDHVTAEQWADFNRGIYGDAAILPVGNKMETAIQTANQITVKDGVAVIDGRQVYIGYGESENIAIQSGTQGKLRRDIVVLEYKKEEVSGVETVQFKVITGTPADSDAKDPSVQDMDIRTGVFTSQKPFCRVRLNGTAIEGVDTLIPVKEFKSHAFAAPVNNLTGTNPDLALAATQGREIKKQIDALNSSLIDQNNKMQERLGTLTYWDNVYTGDNGGTVLKMNKALRKEHTYIMFLRAYNGSLDTYAPWAYILSMRRENWAKTTIGTPIDVTNTEIINDGKLTITFSKQSWTRMTVYEVL